MENERYQKKRLYPAAAKTIRAVLPFEDAPHFFMRLTRRVSKIRREELPPA